MSDIILSRKDLPISVAVGASTVAVGYILYSWSRRTGMDFNKQSIELEDGKRQCTYIEQGQLVKTFFDDVSTLHEAFMRGVRLSNEGPCLGIIKEGDTDYSFLTYKEIHESARKFGSGLAAEGFGRQEKGFLGIFAKNSPQWVMAEQGCNMFSYIVVSLYDTLGLDACLFIMNQVEMKLVLCDTCPKAKMLLDNKSNLPSLQTIVTIDEPSTEIREAADKAGVKVLTFQQILELGENNLLDPQPPEPDDLATICYTSGTTGDPKGVMLTHANLICNSACCFAYWKHLNFKLDSKDSYISYLPLAHMYERMCQTCVYQIGGKIGFFRGDVRTLLDDIRILQPTIFPSVPRLLNRMYDKVQAEISGSWLKRTIFNFALNRKLAEVQSGMFRNDGFWDRVAFKKIHEMLGGHVRLVISGSAPLSAEVFNFCRCAFGCYFMEGYGQTEATAAVSITLPGDPNIGHVGAPTACNFIKLLDVLEMDYYAKENKGEICVKGPNVMKGYYRSPGKTAEAIDADGWLHTGDIGEWLPNGSLKVFDRIKHIFKLAQGEYIAPEKIEQVYIRSPLVAQMFVDGHSLKSCCVGVAVPDADVLPKWAEKQGIQENSMKELCSNPKVKEVILNDIIEQGKSFGLKSFEQVKDIYLNPEAFSVENGLLTPTFKSKRPQLRKHFADVIDEMYGRLD